MKIKDLGNRQVFTGVMALSLVVLGLVILLNSLPQRDEIPAFVAWLPRLNAILNATCTVLLIWSWRMIKVRRIDQHKKLNLTAFVLSSLFLCCFILLVSKHITRKPVPSGLFT